MKDKIILSIGRQFGAGGRVVGQTLADRLQLPYYDRELAQQAAQDSGIHNTFFQQVDEQQHHKFCSFLGLDLLGGQLFYPIHQDNSISSETLFHLQCEAMRKIAQESCVLVGRCSDYVLRDDPALLSVFITANMPDRIQRVLQRQEQQELTPDKAEELIRQADKMRASYYNFYTNRTWGDARHYDLCINSSVFGIENTIEMIEAAIWQKQSR